jgi:hypothetical protein
MLEKESLPPQIRTQEDILSSHEDVLEHVVEEQPKGSQESYKYRNADVVDLEEQDHIFEDKLKEYKNADAGTRLDIFRNALSELKSMPRPQDPSSDEDFKFLDNQYIVASPEIKLDMYRTLQHDIRAERQITKSVQMASESITDLDSAPSIELEKRVAPNPMQSVTRRLVSVQQ